MCVIYVQFDLNWKIKNIFKSSKFKEDFDVVEKIEKEDEETHFEHTDIECLHKHNTSVAALGYHGHIVRERTVCV